MLTVLFSLAAMAVPMQLTHQGRLLDGTGVPIAGPHTVDFRIYDAVSGGVILWSDSLSVDVDDGYYSVRLGSGATLSEDVFDDGDVWLGITVDGGTELTRRKIESVPYALLATTSTNVVGGIVDVSEIRVNGSVVIDDTGMVVAPTAGTGLDDLSCAVGEVPLYDGSAWGCATVGGGSVDWSAITNVPSDLLDGDDDTVVTTLDWSAITGIPAELLDGDAVLTETDVDGMVANNGYALDSSLVDLARSGSWTDLIDIPADLADGDDVLDETTVELFIENGDLDISGGFSATGAVKVGDTTANCDAASAGSIRWNGTAMQVCAGTGWVTIATDQLGSSATNPGASCADILAFSPGSSNGIYWIDPNGGATSDSYQVLCDMTTQGGGWTLLMKVNGTIYPYDDAIWTDTTTLNPTSLDETWTDAKFDSFSTMPIDELLLKSQSGQFTQLSIPGAAQPIRDTFDQTNTTTILTHVAGAADPHLLVSGSNSNMCAGIPEWRINTFNTGYSPSAIMKVRLGGWINYTWDCTSYGTDNAGQRCSAESAGFGIIDTLWGPFVNNSKSFGIRQAHDNNSLPGGGQTVTGGAIWGR